MVETGPSMCNECGKRRHLQKVQRRSSKRTWKGHAQFKTTIAPVLTPLAPGNLNSSQYMVDSRRGLHENHSQLHARREELEKAVAELEAKVKANTPRWKNYEPPQSAMLHSEIPKEQLPGREGLRTNLDLLANAFGVMSLRDARTTQYHGWNAVGEYILRLNESPSSTRGSAPPAIPTLSPSSSATASAQASYPTSDIPPEIFFLHLQFPCPPPQPFPSLLPFLSLLPSHQRAVQLMENYYTYFTWISSPVSLPDIRELFHTFYSSGKPPSHLPPSAEQRYHASTHAHPLAILFGVFLLGSLFDFTNEKWEREREEDKWLKLLRAAIACNPILADSGATFSNNNLDKADSSKRNGRGILSGIQAMVLMAWYLRLCSIPTDRTFQWSLSGYISRLVQSIGIYRNGRDPNLFIQDDDQLSRVEQTFWEYHTQDIWNSFMYGRPPSIANEFIQCRWPTNVEVHPGHTNGYFTWKFSMSSLLADIMTKTALDNTPYEDILREDRRIRAHDVPQELAWPQTQVQWDGETTKWPGFPKDEAVGKTFQRWVVASLHNIALLFLHRPFAWQAISGTEKINPRHPYWWSVVSIYHSAAGIVRNGCRIWEAHPKVAARLAAFWSHTLSAAFALGVVAVYKPDCQFGRGALMYFDEAVDLFVSAGEELSHLSSQREKLLAIQRHAHAAFREHQVHLAKQSSQNSKLFRDSSISASNISKQEGAAIFESVARRPRTHIFQIVGGATRRPPPNEMPAEYEVYRHEEKGWDHLISRLEMR